MSSTRLSDDTLTTVLLCGGLVAKDQATDPLSLAKWNDLAGRLFRAGWWPRDLLRWGVDAAREPLALDEDLADRLNLLLGQAVPVAAEIERLHAAGIRIVSRADENGYPSRWKSRLREKSPPLLFVAGPLSLLERGGIAAVGSRNVDEAGASFARAVGRAAARAGAPTISGGARGVDREAMFGALEAQGEAVGILADSLGRALRAPDVRLAVAEDRLVLASPSRPDARFEVWRAMGRNKLIYALADATVVISSEVERGGTWAGAIENLAHEWSPLFVRTGNGIPEGNRQLIARGALPLSEEDIAVTPPTRLLPDLLDRAEAASKLRNHVPDQQALLDVQDGSRGGGPILLPEDQTTSGDDPGPAKPGPGQLGFGDEF